jgi:hypothetical protein
MNEANSCTVSMLAVAPGHQAAGLGRALLADAERFAANRTATVARMTVVQQRESLIAWYERRGYRRTGYEAFPYGDDSVGTPLREDLQFVVLEKTLRHSRPAAGSRTSAGTWAPKRYPRMNPEPAQETPSEQR